MTAVGGKNLVASLFEQKQIRHLAVIDDAFEPPVRTEYGTTLDDFWAAVEDDDKALAELNTLAGATLAQAGDITDAVLSKIWHARTKLGALKAHYSRYLASVIEGKLGPLNALLKNVQDTLGRTVTCHTKIDTFNDTQARIIFVDYFMGPPGETASVNRSKAIVAGITAKYQETGHLPLLVLMSSTDITTEMIEEFRESTGWLGGMFHFVRKQDFTTPDMLALKLAALVNLVPAGKTIHAFVQALAGAIDDAGKKLIGAIQSLSVEDCAYIQMLSLQEDGHPLGDYMLWLYSSYFGRLLLSRPAVRDAQKGIDKITFDSLPPSQSTPSPLLANIYQAAIFDEMDGDLLHPRRPDQAAGTDQPSLHLGDVFFKDVKNDVLTVLNAQCDLAFTPDSAHRPFKPAKTVLLIPGRLQRMDSPLSEFDASKPRTEVFEQGGVLYRIIWDTKRVTAKQLGEITGWCVADGYKRTARLRLPFAFQLQQMFASDLTRVGMPVAPPISRSVAVQLCCCNAEGKTEVLVETSQAAFIFLTRHGERCVVKEEIAHALKEGCARAADLLQKRIEFMASKGAVAATTDKLRAVLVELQAFAGKAETLFLLRGPFPVPPGQQLMQLEKTPLAVARGLTIPPSYRHNLPLLLNIVPGELITSGGTADAAQ